MNRDEEAALHVVEALLAGMIILTAVLFMTNLATPSPTAFQSGIDLERVSVDTLRILENRPAEESCDDAGPPDPCYPNRLDEIVSQALGHGLADASEQAGKTQTAENFLRQVIPVGNRWLLRLDNGEEPLVLLPTTGKNVELTPRGAKAAETFFVPQWQANAGALADDKCGPPPSDPFVPGGDEGAFDVQVTATSMLLSPIGELAPSGATWTQWWVDEQARFEARDAIVAAENPGLGINPADRLNQIPPTAPYGWWVYDPDTGDANPGTCYFVGLPDGTSTDYPAYGVQLVVWPIAG